MGPAMHSLLSVALGQFYPVPPTPAPAPTVGFDPQYLWGVVFIALLPTLGQGLFGLLKWFGARQVQKADAEQQEVQSRLEEHDKRFTAIERSVDDLRVANEKRFASMDHSLMTMQMELRQSLSVAESIRGAVAELKTGLENRFEKQADFYRSTQKEQTAQFGDALKKLEQDLRHDMTRAVADVFNSPRRSNPKR